MRQRTIAMAAGLSGASALICVGAAADAGKLAAVGGFWLATAATLAAARRRLQGPAARLNAGSDRDEYAPVYPVCITANLICLAWAGQAGRRCAIWRDAIAPQAFRRIAALGRWYRGERSGQALALELIARDAVTRTQVAPRPAWPRTE